MNISKRNVLISIVLIGLPLFTLAAADEEIISNLAELFEATAVNKEIHQIKQFTVFSFDTKQLEKTEKRPWPVIGGTTMNISSSNTPRVFISVPSNKNTDYSFAFGIPNKVQMIDFDGDEKIDFLEYTVKSETEGFIATVYDFDLDGQTDQKFHHPESIYSTKNGYIELWYKTKWYRITKKDCHAGILVQNTLLPVKSGKHGQILVDEQNRIDISTLENDCNISKKAKQSR